MPVACEAEHASIGARAAVNQHQVLRGGSRCVRRRGHTTLTRSDSAKEAEGMLTNVNQGRRERGVVLTMER